MSTSFLISPNCSSSLCPDLSSSFSAAIYPRIRPHYGTRHLGYRIRRTRVRSNSSEKPSSKSPAKPIWKLPLDRKTEYVKRDNNVVFVAGATGKVGSRTVRELLRLGFSVRAGVRSVEKAEALLQSTGSNEQENSRLPNFGPSKFLELFTSRKRNKLEIVECNLEDMDGIEGALGNAGIVVCAIGASEKEVLDVTGPYRIDYKATKNLIDKAKLANINHFVLVTSLGTTKFGWPAAVLNLFWGVLVWKAKAEKALQDSGMAYTIVRPGGMERPTDAYKETHNLLLAPMDTFTGGQVSNLQVAELLACIVNNLILSENKIVEAIAETTAPLVPIEEQLATIPADQKLSMSEKTTSTKLNAVKGESNVKIVKERSAKQQSVRENDAMEKKIKLEMRRKREAELLTLQEEEKLAIREKIRLEKEKAEVLEQAKSAAVAAATAKALADAIADAARRGQVLSEQEKANIVESSKFIDNIEKRSAGAANSSRAVKKSQSPMEDSPNQIVSMPGETKETGKRSGADRKPTGSTLGKQRTVQDEVTKQKDEDVLSKNNDAPVETQIKNKVSEISNAENIVPETIAYATTVDKGAEASKIMPLSERLSSEAVETQNRSKAPENSSTENKETPAYTTVRKSAEAMPQPEKLSLGTESKPFSFTWPWQKPVLDTASKQDNEVMSLSNSKLEISFSTEKDNYAKEVSKRDQLQALSPYVMYPDLKPPSSPTPKPPLPETREFKSNESPKPKQLDLLPNDKDTTLQSKTDIEGEADRRDYAKLVAQREELALKKAKESVLIWPWKQIASDLKSDTTIEPNKTSPLSSSESETTSKGTSTDLRSVSRPLSPYARYPDLKPPSSPSPKPPVLENRAVEIATESSTTDASSSIEGERLEITESNDVTLTERRITPRQFADAVAEREKNALRQAKSASILFWPWQKRNDVAAAEDLPYDNAQNGTQNGTPTSLAEDALDSDSRDAQFTVSPLSPYRRYPDLKPPSSPTPKAPISVVEVPKANTSSPQSSTIRPLSPYTRYIDLKPPSSPSPRPPVVAMKQVANKEGILGDKTSVVNIMDASSSREDGKTSELAQTFAAEVAERERLATEKAKAATTFLWPWQKPQADSED